MEMEGMKYSLVNDNNEYFKMITKCALVINGNCLLELQIKRGELIKHLEAMNHNNEDNNEHVRS